MTITLNGVANSDFAQPLSVTELLESLGFEAKPVIVELDGVALLPREYSESTVREGAVVEIIRVAAGG